RGPGAPHLPGASAPAGTGTGGATRASAGPRGGAGHDGMAAVGPLGPSAPDGGGGAHRGGTGGASAGTAPASDRRGGDVGPYTGTGMGRPVDVCGGSRRGAHASSRGAGAPCCGALAQDAPGVLPRAGGSLG